jgi:hypothetical protein
MKKERLIIRQHIERNKCRLELLQNALERMYCGCLYLDCVEHGSYDPLQIKVIEDLIKAEKPKNG